MRPHLGKGIHDSFFFNEQCDRFDMIHTKKTPLFFFQLFIKCRTSPAKQPHIFSQKYRQTKNGLSFEQDQPYTDSFYPACLAKNSRDRSIIIGWS